MILWRNDGNYAKNKSLFIWTIIVKVKCVRRCSCNVMKVHMVASVSALYAHALKILGLSISCIISYQLILFTFTDIGYKASMVTE